ncbi:hypothetical protein EJD97_000629 [Solanum chilense]|uniref:Uncharacterized protein n=2 Tax=Solanum subgen. Lycopersicon TaxID=49274 RepID=A0A3Q7FCC4_SOLLC|nr:hypothetical protein EJD97_000629 [Solanum chilense]
MAKFYTVLFMLLFISNLVVFSQGRNLATKLNHNVVVALGVKVVVEEKEDKQLGRRGFRFMEGSVDAFSSPGHSPGIGHSKHD